MKANRKTIAIIIATLVLVAAATTGVVMYLNDDGTSRAGFDENEPSISEVNTNTGTTEENNQNNSGENAGNTENPANNNEPGNLPEAGENANQGTNANRNTGTNQGTTTTTNNANVPNQEYVTERIEEVERQITEDLLVGWTPLNINSAYSTNELGIYKPDLKIVKVASTTDGNNSVVAGDALTYAMAVKNDGNEDITGLTISDVIPEQTTFIEGTIYGNGTYNKELNKIVWKVDVKAGEVVAVGFAVTVNDNATGTIKNVGTVDGKDTEEVLNPVITSEKLAQLYKNDEPVEGLANIGDKIKYTVVAKNTGDVDATVVMKDTIPANTELVSEIKIADKQIDEATMNAGKTVTVPAGKTVELTFTVEVKSIDGSIKNIATVGTTTPDTETKTANLEMAKTVSAEKDGEYSKNVTLKVGETAYFKIELKNTGSEDLEVTMTDIMNDKDITLYDGDKAIAQTVTVPAGTTKILTATYKMQQEDIDNQQQLKNIATATTPVTPGIEDGAEITPEEAKPEIKVKKTATMVNGKNITDGTKVSAGDKVTYTITVTNIGNVTLHNVEVTDSLKVKYNGNEIDPAQNGILGTIKSLAPGASPTYTVEYEVTQNDVDTKATIVNTATATDGTTTGTDTDKTIPTDKTPGIKVEKTATLVNGNTITSETKVVAGDKITYTIVVTNNGNVTLHNVVVKDSLKVKYNGNEIDPAQNGILGTIESLAPGASPTYTVEYEVTQNDVDTKATIVNTATATDGTTTDEKPSNPVPVNPNVTLTGTKSWNDNENQDGVRPDNITIAVISSDKTDKTERLQTIGKQENGTYDWTYEFTGLPKYDANGNEINYSVTETGIDENYYTSKPEQVIKDDNGNFVANITNEHTPAIISLTVTKHWTDSNNQDGYRPTSITIKVKDEQKNIVGTEELKGDLTTKDWTKVLFNDLPKYKEGKQINYTIIEEITTNADKYTASEPTITVDSSTGNITAEITNTHTPETVTISGTKNWVGDNEAQRPESITVRLMNGTTEVAYKNVNAEDNWEYDFGAQPKYANGKEIEYTIKEDSVEGYTATTNGYNITNTYVKPTLTISKTSNVKAEVKLGDEITYTITAKNTGKVTAKSVVITDAIPVNTTLKEGTISDNGVNKNGTITWTIERLAVGESKNVSFKVTVNNSADVIGKKITNTGYVNGDPTNETTTTVSKTIAITKKEYPVKAIDVVLVLDVSSSMNDFSRIENAKKATCSFIDEMFPTGTNKTGSTVTVITFGNNATTLGKATNATEAKTLKTTINAIEIPDSVGTNVQEALKHTNNVLNNLKNTNKFVVFLGDGEPTPSYVIAPGDYGSEWYTPSNFPENTESNIRNEANEIKSKTTGVYTIGFGMDKLAEKRAYWSHYTECTVRNCKDPKHVTVNAGDANKGKSYHWESEKTYATRILRDIIADTATNEKQYYYTATDSAESIVRTFMNVLTSISTTTSTVKAESKTVKIPVTGGTVNTTRNIVIKIGGEAFECKISELPKYGVSYTKTSSEEYFTWDLTEYAMENLEIEYTIK